MQLHDCLLTFSFTLCFIINVFFNEGYGRMNHQLQPLEMQPYIVEQR
uniref:Uncharacterized protein n=1 Tax=Rhizophora mucronata TaxID=61149 RepID=A0A2P2KKL7_RHIMU